MKLKALRITLTLFYAIFALIGIVSVVLGKLPFYFIIVITAYLSTAAALNSKGGKFARITAFVVSELFIIIGLLFIALVISTFFNHEYDNLTPVILATFGIVGAATFISLRKITI